jgi:hypothetical protein
MAKQSGLGDNFLIGGYNLSGDIASLSRIGGGPAAMEMTGIDKSAPERFGGERDGAIEFSSWFNKATDQEHLALRGLPTVDTQAAYLRGTTLGNDSACIVAKQVNYDFTRGADGGLSLAVSCVGNAYALEWGKQLTAGVRTDTTATNGTGIDYGSVSTLFGLQAYLQVLSVTGTSVTVTLQDSADNVSFANVTGGAFAAATTRGFQRIATANNLTVRRYLRAITSGTFSNAQFQVTVCRNETLVAF